MFRFVRILFCAVLVIPATSVLAAETEVTLLMFEDQDSQQEPAYMTRMLLTGDYLRLDDGQDHGDFALLDRKDGTLYSVSHEEQRTLVIPAQPVIIAPPKKLRHDVEELDAGGVPDVGGNKVSRYYLFTNGTRCTEIYAVKGFYPDAVKALAVFSKTLAGQHAKSMEAMPDSVSSDCDIANNIFAADRHLNMGFPIRQKDFSGRSRQLVTVKDDVIVDASMFELPLGYQKFMPGVLPH